MKPSHKFVAALVVLAAVSGLGGDRAARVGAARARRGGRRAGARDRGRRVELRSARRGARHRAVLARRGIRRGEGRHRRRSARSPRSRSSSAAC